MKLGIVQHNPILADFAGNCEQLLQQVHVAKQQGADFCLAPALALCGYGAEALCENAGFIEAHENIVAHFAKEHKSRQLPPVLFGGIGVKQQVEKQVKGQVEEQEKSQKREQCFVLVKDGQYEIVSSFATTSIPFGTTPTLSPSAISFITIGEYTFALALAKNVFTYGCVHNQPQCSLQSQTSTKAQNQTQNEVPLSLVAELYTLGSVTAQAQKETVESMPSSSPKIRVQVREEKIAPAQADVAKTVQGIFILGAEIFAQELFAHIAPCLTQLAERTRLPVAFVNSVGGTDGHICFGASLLCSSQGEYCGAPSFQEATLVASLGNKSVKNKMFESAVFTQSIVSAESTSPAKSVVFATQPCTTSLCTPLPLSLLWQALVLGTRDYVHKNGFSKVVLGLSGGIDSALVATIAVEALGPDNVIGVLLPSAWSSQGSIDDSEHLAKNLGITAHMLPIANVLTAQQQSFEQAFLMEPSGIALENMQARLRGLMLMTYANTTGVLVLPTSNKSELAVGFCTLYGDMCGGFFILGDVYKIQVFALCHYFNAQKGYAHIPINILEKEPSAELHPEQKDSDNLPDYAVLDPLLKGLWEEKLSFLHLEEKGFARKDIERIDYLLRTSAFKRRQAAFSLQVSLFPLQENEQPFLTRKYMSS